jgi:hypothetical protein
MNKYNKQVLQNEKFKNSTKTTVQINKTNKTQMEVSDVSEIVKGLQAVANKKGEKVKIMVRALLVDKWITLKGYDQELDLMDFGEYYENKVADSSKFDKFIQLQVSIAKQNK